MKIFDCHTHIFSPELCADKDRYLSDPVFALLYSGPASKLITAEDLLRQMDSSGVEYSIAAGFPWAARKFVDEQNGYLARAEKISGGRIIPFASVPQAGGDELAEWFSALTARGFKGVGEIAFYNGNISASDWLRLEEILSLCSKNSLAAMIHVNEPVGHGYPGKYDTDFARLVKIISSHPDVKIILAHWGGGILFYELMPEIKKAFANVYYDTAATPYLYDEKIYAAAVSTTGAEKILFGSDYPLIAHSRYVEQISRTLDSASAEKVLFTNAAGLFL